MTSKVLYKGNLRTECIHLKSNSQICTDAPTDNNGKGESFSPTDLVATSLASCMITVMGIKAAQSEIAFSEISASVIKVMGTNPRRIVKIKIDIERGKDSLSLEIKTIKICSHRIILSQDNSLNAYADGKNIFITQGMLRFIEEDKELQMIIAHELAHNIEGHIEKKSNNFILGTIVDLAASSAGINTRGTFGNIGAQMYSQDFEREADYVGMYILANSDINRKGVANFWRRMSIENPGSISYASSHPSSSERWVNIEAINKEIDSKITKSLPLTPERKKDK